MGTKTCYLCVLIWIIWKSRISLCTVPDPCPEIQPSTQVTDMCQAGSAVEDISESNAGKVKNDRVTLRARTQEENCICRVFIEEQSLESFTIYLQPYEKLPSSTPKAPECGLELYLGLYDKEILQPSQNTGPIKCTSGKNDRSFSLKRNSELRFKSIAISGNFTRGYCIEIQRVHVNGQNGTLKIVCDVPGRIPFLNLTTDSTDHPTGHTSSGSSSSTLKDESTLYIAIGGSAGGLLIIIVVIVIILYRRKFSEKNIKKTETSKTDTVPTNEHDDSDYNGLKYNMLYVSADNQDALEGDYHTVDNNQEPTHRKVSDHDINYSTVDDVACSSFNTVPTHEVFKNTKKGLGYENSEGKEIAKRMQNISQEGNSNTYMYAVVDKRRIIGKNHNKNAALSPVYAVVDKTGKLKMENK